MIHGIQHLIALRKSGRRPVFLEVDVDCPYFEPRYANEFARLVLVASGDLRLDDFRPFVGLDVMIYAPKANPTYTDLIDRMKEYADRLTIFCGEYGTDLGWEWSKKWGDCELGETRWAEQWDRARTTIANTKAETDERIRLEVEALAHCPWITERFANGKAAA
jgi:hypothetical protein